MRILALIAARGESKRLPGKNIRLLNGVPLIVWSIDVVRDVEEICDILVSTDDQRIADTCCEAGALVPWLRPAELACDTASSADVCLHALDWYERERGIVTGLLLLQPTSPFRSRETILRGIDLFRANECRTVLGVSPAESHPLWCFRIEGNALRPFAGGHDLNVRSQDLHPAYTANGAFYLIAPEELRRYRSFYGGDMIPLLFDDPLQSVDIDTEWDWKIAEAILQIHAK